MNLRRMATLASAIAVTAVALLLALAPRAHAACPYFGIDTTTTYLASANPSIVLLPQSQLVWSAFAVRPAAGEDWDVTLYQNSAADPTCVANPLASSTFGGSVVDFVIGDYAHNPAGTYYADVTRFSGASGALVRWRESPQVMTVNGPTLSRSWGANDLIETWNVSLVAGQQYTVNFSAAGGIDAKVMLFRNPAAGTYWAGRAGAVLTSSVTTTYLAPSTGTYAVVVVNDNGANGTFSLGIGTCTTPIALASGTTVNTPLGDNYYQFTQSAAYWTAVGVRSTSADYDVNAWSGTAGSWPSCFSGGLAASTGVGVVDFVIGDFNANPTGTYYANTLDYSTTGGAAVEWDSGADLLTVNAAPVSRISGASDVLEVWDVFLTAGQTYNFAFNATGSNMHLLLFRNTGGGVYWSGRSGAQFDVTGCQSYMAPASGYYGVVVTNETGASATYTLGVSQAPCACAQGLVSETPASAGTPDAYFDFTDSYAFWAVVGTRGVTNADDWDLTVSGAATGNPAPTCIGPAVIASSFGAGLADIGVIDFNQTPSGTYYVRSHHFSGAAPSGIVEWDQTHGELIENGPYQTLGIPASEVAHVWDAYMYAGVTYTLEYTPSDPTIKLMVFENAAGGTYMATRSAAALLTSSTTSYTPTVSGYHALVVVNDAAVNGSYVLRYGTCGTPTALANNVAQSTSQGIQTFTIAPVASQWTAVGVRAGATDWDLKASATSSSPFPNCVGGPLASSTSGNLNFVDFVTGDFFHDPPATYYVQANQFTGGAYAPGTVEWSAGGGEVIVNDNNVLSHATNANDVLQSWSVSLASGTQYTFNFNHAGGATLHLLLFQNAGGATYWTGRSGAVADLTPGGGPFNYVAPTSGEYGIVVANDDGGTDNYSLTIKACTTATALASGVSTTDVPENFHSFAQSSQYWTAVGVRSTTDWDIEVNSNPGGGAPGICQSGTLGSSTFGGTTVDFVVGDFNTGGNPTGTYYTRDFRFSGTGVGTVEWDSGPDAITVGAAPIHRTTDASDVLEVWDVFLNAGQTYGIYFAHYGAVDAKVFVFRNPGGAYWAGRSGNVYQSSILGNYTAPSTGWYGLVVVNDNGAAGDYYLGVNNGPLAVQPSATPHVTELRTVQPNPSRVNMSIEYSLSERSDVHVQMIDLSGRVVAEIEQGSHDAGVWRSTWNGMTTSGRKAAPGLYLVRLEVGGRTIGQRKVTVLD